MATLKKWIKIPGEDQQPGQGSWHEVRGDKMLTDFNACKAQLVVPVAWEISDAEVVKAPGTRKDPVWTVVAGVMTNQFHRIATTVQNPTPAATQFAQRQIMHLLKTVLVIEGEFTHETEN